MTRRAKTNETGASSGGLPPRVGEFLGIVLVSVGLLTLGGLFSYQSGSGQLMGPVGEVLASALYASFGMGAYLVGLGLLALAVRALRGHALELRLGEALGFGVATFAACILLHATFTEYRLEGYTSGGLLGELLGEVLTGLFHRAGTYLVACTLLCLGLIASTPLTGRHLLDAGKFLGKGGVTLLRASWAGLGRFIQAKRELVAEAREAFAAERAREANQKSPREAGPREEDGEAWEDEEDDTWEEGSGEDDDEAEVEDEAEDRDPDGTTLGGLASEPRPGRSPRAVQKQHATTARAIAAVRGAARSSSSGLSMAPAELPEIVVAPDALSVGGDVGREAAVRSAAGKKAPPRPEELDKKPEKRALEAAPTPAEDRTAEELPGVIMLHAGEYRLPALELFDPPSAPIGEIDKRFVLEQAERLVVALAEFKIRGKVTKIHPGPVITRYEFKPEAGVKLSKIESLENDIAMALEAIRIRILAPIPGKATVGFEVPNQVRETVVIREILADEASTSLRRMRLPMALGKDITGKALAIDMAKAPHLLVAGATGSGKSVGVNAMICSLLYTSSPEDVRMIMIDPKMLELSVYEGIPHLLLPVVTDPEKANLALRWAVAEMERRYALLSEAQVRDIAGYNRKLPELMAIWEADAKLAEHEAARVREAIAEDGEDAVPTAELSGVITTEDGEMSTVEGGIVVSAKPVKLPYIVVIIDEFADLMMVASKEVEQSVARIAAKARAAGIHLIVATQRPSVDVITGTIKNNFPSRIAFQVTSDADSRTILDCKGAKQLLGMGDMLHMDRGGEPNRIHGCYVSDDEVLRLVSAIKKQAKPVYNMDIVRKQDDAEAPGAEEAVDALYDRAVQIVAETQKVSTSMIQRRLNIGYNRAARIVESMEAQGVIGPARGTAPREVYVQAA